MRIVGELNKEELNIGGRGVGFNPSSQALSFEDILNLISLGENIQDKRSEIPFNPAVPSEGFLEVQGHPTATKEKKGNDFLINLSIFGLLAYGQIKQIFEEEDAKADNVLNGADTNLSAEEKTNTSLVQFKNLKEQSQNTLTKPFTKANKEEKIGNNEFLADFIVKPVEGRNVQVSNLFNVGKEYIQVKVPNTKINTAQFFAKTSHQIIENPIPSADQKPQNPLNINQTNADNGLKNGDEPQTKEFVQGFFDSSELEFYPKEEHAKADLRNNSATISSKVTKNVLEDLPQRVEKSELSPIEKNKKEEEHSHLYNMVVSPQRFEDKIENVQEVKNTKRFHTFHEAKSLYVKLEEGDFRIRVIKDAISVKVDFREDFRPPTVQEVQNLIESLSKVGFRMEMLSLNGKKPAVGI
jgi:hypothetical protein